ncbi:MAG: transposase [Glaciimonas sp.]|nr:transposase [Glaciimonas sp.]
MMKLIVYALRLVLVMKRTEMYHCRHIRSAYIELYNWKVRYDWLAYHLFDSINEVQNFATSQLWTYNHDRPHMGLGGITPKQKLALAA